MCLSFKVFFPFQDDGLKAEHHDPMVAMICPDKVGDRLDRLYHNQYITTSGKWATDFDHSATCRTDKVEILEYCKKVYPDLDINNIVESNHYTKIGNWCKLGRKKCKGPARFVKPYRCLCEYNRYKLLPLKYWVGETTF